MPGLDAQGLDALLERRISIELGHSFVAGAAHVRGLKHHQRHAIVDAGHRQRERRKALARHRHHVTHLAGGQQARADRARSVQEVDGDRRRAAGHAVNPGVAAIAHSPALRRHGRLHGHIALHVGVERQHPHRGGVALWFYQATFQRKRHHRGQHVAAVGAGVHGVFVRLQLGEQKIQRHARRTAGADDANLAGQRVGAAQSVNLAPVRRAHHGQQHAVAGGHVGGQVRGQKKRAARAAATHKEGGDGSLHGPIVGPMGAALYPSRPAMALQGLAAVKGLHQHDGVA